MLFYSDFHTHRTSSFLVLSLKALLEDTDLKATVSWSVWKCFVSSVSAMNLPPSILKIFLKTHARKQIILSNFVWTDICMKFNISYPRFHFGDEKMLLDNFISISCGEIHLFGFHLYITFRHLLRVSLQLCQPSLRFIILRLGKLFFIFICSLTFTNSSRWWLTSNVLRDYVEQNSMLIVKYVFTCDFKHIKVEICLYGK